MAPWSQSRHTSREVKLEVGAHGGTRDQGELSVDLSVVFEAIGLAVPLPDRKQERVEGRAWGLPADTAQRRRQNWQRKPRGRRGSAGEHVVFKGQNSRGEVLMIQVTCFSGVK